MWKYKNPLKETLFLKLDFENCSIKELYQILCILNYCSSLTHIDIISLAQELIKRYNSMDPSIKPNKDMLKLTRKLIVSLQKIPNAFDSIEKLYNHLSQYTPLNNHAIIIDKYSVVANRYTYGQ